MTSPWEEMCPCGHSLAEHYHGICGGCDCARPQDREGLVPLPQALAEHEAEQEELVPDLPCLVDGQPENLHATLERTCVIGPAVLDIGDERYLVRHHRVMVDPGALRWQPRPTPLQRYWSVRASTQGRAQAKANRDRKAKTPA